MGIVVLPNIETIRFQASLLDAIGEAVIATDPAGIVNYWNAAAERMYGWTAHEAVGRPIVDLTPAPQSVQEAAAIFGELAAGNRWSGEFVVRHRDGTAFWAHVANTPVFGKDGVLETIIGISSDITERKRTEHMVQHLSAIVESSSDAIIGKAADGTILSWNKGAESLYGYSAAEVAGQSIRILAHDEASDREIIDVMRRVALGQQVQGLETVRRHKDGNLVEVSLSISPVYDVNGSMTGFSTIGRDDSARRETERALHHQAELMTIRLAEEAEAAERLRELDRIKDDLIATVSHELRTPLTSILGYLELVKDEEAGSLTAQQRKHTDVIDRNGDRLRTLIDNLLTVATIEAGKLASDSSPVDLGEVVASARQAVKSLIDGRRITTLFDLPKLPILIRGDADQLEQVVSNLLSNALKFTEDGGTVECAASIEGSMAKILVSDNGIGIPEDEQRNLFEKFFRSSAATDRAIPGTGLGLSIASSIVRNHGGEIAIVSTSGRGTQVLVTLPLDDGADGKHSPATTP